MAKQGQHKHDDNDPRVSKGPNNPDKSVEITTGSYKKPETYEKQAAAHTASDKPAQHDKNEWDEDTRDKADEERNAQVRKGETHSGRSGSQSNGS